MKKGIGLLFILSFLVWTTTEAQVRIVNNASNSAAMSSSAFIDASSNNTSNISSNIGKGLVYPRTDLTTFGAFSGTPTGVTISYPTRFDGMVVYNTGTGTAPIGGTLVYPGFYYYKNKSTNLTDGTWVRLIETGDIVALSNNIAGGTAGDLLYQTAAGATGKLAIGTNGQVLTVESGFPIWKAASSGFANPMTLKGDVIFSKDASGTAERLAIGSSGQILTVNTSGLPEWAANSGISSVTGTSGQILANTISGAVTLSLPTTITGLTSVSATTFTGNLTGTASKATNVDGGAKGSIPYQTAAGATSLLTLGSTSQVLTVDASGVPVWANAATGFTNPMNASGDIIYGGALGAATRLGVGSNGQVLTLSSGVPSWSNAVTSITGSSNLTASASSGSITLSLPTTITGLTSVTAGSFIGALTGNATTATTSTNIAGGANGSIPYQTAAGATSLLAAGSTNQVLTVNASGVPVWANAATGFTNPMNASGDIIYGGASGTATRLGVGSNGQVLTLSSGVPSWSNAVTSITGTSNQITASASSGSITLSLPTTITGLTSVTATTFTGALTGNATTATTSTNIVGGAKGSIPYQTAAGATSLLTLGSTSQVLTVDATGLPVWANAATGFTNPMNASGDIIYGGASGAATRLGVGTNGQVLTLSSGVPSWSNAVTSITGTSNQITASASSGSITLSLPTTITGLTSVSATTFTGNLTGTASKATNVDGGAKGSLPYQTAAGATSLLTAGSAGQVLTLDGTSGLPVWKTPSSGGPLNVRNESASFTALATDDILIVTVATQSSVTITLPTTGIDVGKKYYILPKLNDAAISPVPVSDGMNFAQANVGTTFMYIGGTDYITLIGY